MSILLVIELSVFFSLRLYETTLPHCEPKNSVHFLLFAFPHTGCSLPWFEKPTRLEREIGDERREAGVECAPFPAR
ncbi:hypothetical protein KDV65_01310 [Serratia marcescens]|uniref:hypothetical protein n=1 Tax=Serratia marcescens TaxID=615 RepID=UPI00332B7743